MLTKLTRPLKPRNWQKRRNAADQAGDGSDGALDQLVKHEKDACLGEAPAHDIPGIGDLVLASGNVAAVDQVDHHRDMAGLDDVEDVFADPVNRDRNHAEADQAAPEGKRQRPVGIDEIWPTPKPTLAPAPVATI